MDAQADPPAQDPEAGGIAAPVPAEPEVAADDDFPGAEFVREDAVDEIRAGEPGEGRVEGRHDDGVDARIAEPFQPLIRSVDHSDRFLAESTLRMGIESQDERPETPLFGQAAKLGQDLPVTEVETVEIAHGNGGGAGVEAGVIEAAINDHAATS